MSGTLVLVLRILLAAALYLFLGLTLWMIWQDMRRAGYQAMRPRIPALRLEVRARGAEPFYRVFSQPEVTIGREPLCELQLEDEAVSARHAKFSFHHGQWWVEDLHSTNGTSLNTVKLTTATVLADGDEVRCGKAILHITLSTDTAILQPTKAEEQHD
jgi:pSer/pThr/pTyr-binding forkhead associated (FHA) protein